MISQEEAFSKCTPFIKSWSNISPNQIDIQKLPGASSQTLKISVADKDLKPNSVLLRIYSDKVKTLVDREKEKEIFSYFSKTPYGANLIYECPEYRIEELLNAKKLTIFELGNKFILRRIAQILASYHNDKNIGNIVQKYDDKTPFSIRFLDTWFNKFKKKYITKLKNYKFSKPENTQIIKEFEFLLTPEFEKQYKDLLEKLKNDKLVICHGDVHEMNFLQMQENKEKLVIIDFEYSTFNYRSNDIAMLLCETIIDYSHPNWPNYTIVEENKWDYEMLKFFCEEYLRNDAEINKIDDQKTYIFDELPKLINNVKIAEMIVNIIWAVWCFLVIDWKNFDENKEWKLEYAKTRLDLYKKAYSVYNHK